MTTGRFSASFCYLFAGLEAGVLGGVLALAWLAVISLWQGWPIWTFQTVVAAALGNELSFQRGAIEAAAAGAAVVLIVGGLCGAVFGLAVRGYSRSPRVRLMGLLVGLCVHYAGSRVISEHWLWQERPGFDRPLLVAGLLLGLVLGSYPRLLRSIRRTFLEED